MNKEEWHKYYLENKNRFTNDKLLALVDKNKIYVEQSFEYDSIRNENLRYVLEIQEHGDLLEWFGIR